MIPDDKLMILSVNIQPPMFQSLSIFIEFLDGVYLLWILQTPHGTTHEVAFLEELLN